MSTEVYDVGDIARLSLTVATTAGVAAAATVRLLVKDPSGNVTVISSTALTNPATGTYRYDVDVDEAGWWRYQWDTTGAIVGSEQGGFSVRRRAASTA